MYFLAFLTAILVANNQQFCLACRDCTKQILSTAKVDWVVTVVLMCPLKSRNEPLEDTCNPVWESLIKVMYFQEALIF